jgi:hypothetical protein
VQRFITAALFRYRLARGGPAAPKPSGSVLKAYHAAPKDRRDAGLKTQKKKKQSGAIARIKSINVIYERDFICPLTRCIVKVA